ncbi:MULTISPECIES: ion transporter [Chroococcidiopsis]|jgi:voltage-gated potassium channel|uniref:Ion transport 2 domain protein n=1 Tax=Chroococcidiopsis thermalis (strain PCC 7203) TaxID=251229 RepID=K9U4Y7_CHRTP|nr:MULTISPECIES: ion transporter [Chroococcidiopsis]AFY89279.1 Ion transport 2 domain protein [Chroococcidiopsis thermalis PCC 7203]URD48387.1 ion transporter [Chroococcidiopsis sp. CCNUC1]
MKSSEKHVLNRERQEILQQLEDWLETPMLLLGFAWLALFVVELIWGLTPLLQAIGTVVWIIFILDFILEFTLAPHKLAYLRRNWLTVIALPLPALRLFRFVRVLRVLNTARAARGIRLLRVITRTNRGMRAIGASLGRRGFGYVVATTLVITLVGAAGMYAFESNIPNGEGLNDYGSALWWTAMLMTTMGSEYWPQTPEGRVLCFFLALYAFAVFGYLTAAIATFFIGRDADDDEAEIAGAKSIAALHAEITALRQEIQALSRQQSEQ